MTDSQPYRVLARKYRPQTFAELVGQEALVRTLANAIARNRLAHAYLFTGLRGIGKTTTARLLAKTLNCIGADGQLSQPTITPCGVCEHCVAIAEDRHVDVMEMDAASRTGVDDVRELIESVRYRPSSARYKVYIIDEVHMLSRNAFNALLKTLEEPPPHVKFIFATTDAHKVPVTVLSRCQRFDLPRLPIATLAAHLLHVAALEQAVLEEDAAHVLARAAEGSARDGLSLLDQAIALAEGDAITTTLIADMLGMAGHGEILDLLRGCLAGNMAATLEAFDKLYHQGRDPLTILKALLDAVHYTSRAKIAPALMAQAALTDADQQDVMTLAAEVGMAALTQSWQILLQGASDARTADDPKAAVEMALIRLCYAGSLPPLEQLLKTLDTHSLQAATTPSRIPAAAVQSQPAATSGNRALAMPQPAAVVEPQLPQPASFNDVVALFEEKREAQLSYALKQYVRLVHFRTGHLEINLTSEAPSNTAGEIARYLQKWTGQRWTIAVSQQTGAATIAEQQQQQRSQQQEQLRQHPLVQAALATFPDAEILPL